MQAGLADSGLRVGLGFRVQDAYGTAKILRGEWRDARVCRGSMG